MPLIRRRKKKEEENKAILNIDFRIGKVRSRFYFCRQNDFVNLLATSCLRCNCVLENQSVRGF